MRKKYFNEIAVALGRAIRRYKRLRVFYGSEQGSDSAGTWKSKIEFFLPQNSIFSEENSLNL
jgi:hypothetical protein